MIHILVVDDDPQIVRVISNMLERVGQFEVVTAADGTAALKTARAEPPDVILLDINMPRMDGLTVLRELGQRDETKYIPVIMLTGEQNDEFREQAMYDYAAGYLEKPIEMKVLLDAIKRVLNPPISE